MSEEFDEESWLEESDDFEESEGGEQPTLVEDDSFEPEEPTTPTGDQGNE